MIQNNRRANIIKGLFIILIIAVALSFVDLTAVGRYLLSIRSYIQSFGIWAPIVFFFVYVISMILLVPISVMSVTAVAVLGIIPGMIVSSAGAAAGGGLCFLISRFIAHGYIQHILEKSSKFKKLDSMTKNYGALIVFIARIIPIFPAAVLNYGFGLTKISFPTFLLWSWLGMLPDMVLYGVGTDMAYKFIVEHMFNYVSLSILLAAGIVVAVFAVYAHRNIIKSENNEGQ